MSFSISLATERFAGNRAKECSAISANVIATCFALVGFASGIVVGWAAGNSTSTILWRSWVAFLLCYVVGKIVGSVAQHTIEKNIEDYKREHPIPQNPAASPTVEATADAEAADENVTSRSAA